MLTDVRAAATAVSDVAEWARRNGAPADFSGEAAEAADHAVTKFAGDTDAVSAALERGALAIDELPHPDAAAPPRARHADGSSSAAQRRTPRPAAADRGGHRGPGRGTAGRRRRPAATLRVLPPGPPGVARPHGGRRGRRDPRPRRRRPARRRTRGGPGHRTDGHGRAGSRAAPARRRHRRRQRVVGRAVAERAQRAADQRSRPGRQHQRHPDRRPRRGQPLRGATRPGVPPRSAGLGPGPQPERPAVAGERPVHRAGASPRPR